MEAAQLWHSTVAAYGKSYRFSFIQRQTIAQASTGRSHLESLQDTESTATVMNYARKVNDWLAPPAILENIQTCYTTYCMVYAMINVCLEVILTSESLDQEQYGRELLHLAPRSESCSSSPDLQESSTQDQQRLVCIYLQFVTKVLFQFSMVMKEIQRIQCQIYPKPLNYSNQRQQLAVDIQKLFKRCHQSFPVSVSLDPPRLDMVDDIDDPRNLKRRSIETFTRTIGKPRRSQDIVVAMQKLRTWLQPSDEVDEERTLQSSRLWPKTCSWIFAKQSYQDWFSADQSSILWFHARPGAGKSVLASHFTQLIEEAGEISAYFCFRYNSDILRSPQTLLRSFAFQVSEYHSSACLDLLRLCDEGIVMSSSRIGTAWKKLFIDTLFRTPIERPVYWIIDALDECDEAERLPFIRLLADVSKSSNNFKIIIFSRYLRDIASAFQQMPVPVEEITPEDNVGDISLFARKRIQRSAALADLSEDILPRLVEHSNGCFLWVAKILDTLDNIDSTEEILSVLDQLPSGMDDLYAKIFADMAKNSLSQVNFAKTILNWVLCVKRPLSLPEISYVIETLHGKVANVRKLIQNTCGQLISIDKSSRVQVNHMTTHEYLTRADITCVFRVDSAIAHTTIARFCLHYLSRPGQLIRIASPEELSRELVFIEYTSAFWSFHVAGSDYSDTMLQQVIDLIQSNEFYGWLHTLSLLSNLRYIAMTVSNLEVWADRHAKQELNQPLQRLRNIAHQLGCVVSQYVGAQLGDKRHGFGTCTYVNGDSYEGNWENDLQHGFGEYRHQDGSKYTGWWSKNEYHGQGTLESADGSKYIGEWVAGKKENYGIMTWTWMERYSYEGDWKDDRPHGHGTMIFCWGTRYEGEWRNGCENGKGKIMYWNGNHYSGEFANGDEVGEIEQGCIEEAINCQTDSSVAHYRSLKYASGAMYEGEVGPSGFPHGQGTLRASTGITWTGNFRNGLFHGPGVSTRPNGGTMRGTWHNQIASGTFEDINDKENGGRYYGDFQDTTRHGHGILESPCGFVYEGEFVKNEMHGAGERRYSNGDVYVGNSAHGSLHGQGKMIYKKAGTVYEGCWNNNQKHGEGVLTLQNGYIFTGLWTCNVAISGRFTFILPLL